MSGRFTRGAGAADHDRARELAATRLDEALPGGDIAWLEDHLAACADCAAVGAAYDEQRLSLRALRVDSPEPPRDLWARTAAALEAEGAARARRAGWLSRGLPLAPVAGVMVVAIAVGMGLLNGRSLFPDSTSKGDGQPMPTPMNVAAAEVETLTRLEDGTVQIQSRRLTQVCPMGADACGLSPSFDVTTTATISGSADLDAIISPRRDRMVVVDRGEGAGGVYVVDMVVPPSASPPSASAPALTADPGISVEPPTAD
ncbi:MAG: anti-sigma factor family protein, partial [Candidatus Limnocylindrales bacterium]